MRHVSIVSASGKSRSRAGRARDVALVPPHHSTLLNDLKVLPKIAQEHLGHASIATTPNIYTHVVDGPPVSAPSSGFERCAPIRSTDFRSRWSDLDVPCCGSNSSVSGTQETWQGGGGR